MPLTLMPTPWIQTAIYTSDTCRWKMWAYPQITSSNYETSQKSYLYLWKPFFNTKGKFITKSKLFWIGSKFCIRIDRCPKVPKFLEQLALIQESISIKSIKNILLFLFMQDPGNPLFCPNSNNAYRLWGLYLGCVFGPKGQKISLFADIGKSQFKEWLSFKIDLDNKIHLFFIIEYSSWHKELVSRKLMNIYSFKWDLPLQEGWKEIFQKFWAMKQKVGKPLYIQIGQEIIQEIL